MLKEKIMNLLDVNIWNTEKAEKELKELLEAVKKHTEKALNGDLDSVMWVSHYAEKLAEVQSTLRVLKDEQKKLEWLLKEE